MSGVSSRPSIRMRPDCGVEQPAEQVEDGALACPRHARHHGEGSRRQRQVDTAQHVGMTPAIAEAHVLQPDLALEGDGRFRRLGGGNRLPPRRPRWRRRRRDRPAPRARTAGRVPGRFAASAATAGTPGSGPADRPAAAGPNSRPATGSPPARRRRYSPEGSRCWPADGQRRDRRPRRRGRRHRKRRRVASPRHRPW